MTRHIPKHRANHRHLWYTNGGAYDPHGRPRFVWLTCALCAQFIVTRREHPEALVFEAGLRKKLRRELNRQRVILRG